MASVYIGSWNVVRRYILENRPLWFFVAFGALTTYILWPFYPGEAGPRSEWVGDVAVEGFGFLMDIVLFGLLWSVFDVYRERRAKIRDYHDQLRAFHMWKGEEGVLRKVGIIRWLTEDLQALLPSLYGIHLEGAVLSSANLKGAVLMDANLKGAVLENANLERAALWRANLDVASLRNANLKRASSREANLKGAFLVNANLERANLLNANLEGAFLAKANLEGAALWNANLAGAKDLTWYQLETAMTDYETILPAYLKEDAPESYKGKFAGEEGE